MDKIVTTLDWLKHIHTEHMDSEWNGELSSTSNWRETNEGIVYRKNV
jgi:hypothetical protein